MARIIHKLMKLWYKLFPALKHVGVRALVLKENQVLLVKHTYMDGWYCIGGGVEKGEPPLQALQRELMEEGGIELANAPKLFGIYYNILEGKDDYIAFYICKNTHQKSPTQTFEIKEMKWFPLEKLPKALSSGTRRRIEEYLGKRVQSDKW